MKNARRGRLIYLCSTEVYGPVRTEIQSLLGLAPLVIGPQKCNDTLTGSNPLNRSVSMAEALESAATSK